MDLEVNLLFNEQALKQLHCKFLKGIHKHCDHCFLLSASNICERLFSVAGHALSRRREGIAHVTFGGRLFPHMTRDLCFCKESLRDSLSFAEKK